MQRRRWWQFLSSLGLEFWLPLPLLGLAFWAIALLVTNRQLNQSNQQVSDFQISQNSSPVREQVFSIKVIVARDRHVARVKVKQTKSIFQKQEFTLQTTEFKGIEAAIAQKLGLSPQEVKKLVRYQIKN